MTRGTRNWLGVLLLVLLPLAVPGCIRTQFTPHTASDRSLSPVTKEAEEAQPGDIPALAAAGGELVGTLDTRGAPLSSVSGVHYKSRKDAAKHGATHVILADLEFVEVKLTQDTATTTCYGNTCETRLQEGAKGHQKHASYVLVRVPPENWGKLPEALRPVPLPNVKWKVEEGIRAAESQPVVPKSQPVVPESQPAVPEAPILSVAEIARRAKPSLVIVRTDDGGLGAGFSISNRGWVATSFHVVAGARAIELQDNAGRKYAVSGVRAFDIRNDLAIIEAPGLALPAMSIATQTPQPGEAIVAIGHPAALTGTVSNGIVAAVRDLGDGLSVLQFTAPISPGSSGGPLLNSRGQVVGVTSFFFQRAQNINFASTSVALAHLAQNAPPQGMPMTRFAAISAGTRDASESQAGPPTAGAPTKKGRPPFPQKAAGFSFGSTVADASAMCSEDRGSGRISWLGVDKNWASCPFLPVPLHFAEAPVGLVLFTGRVAKILFYAKSVEDARMALVAKYGEPDLTGTYNPKTKEWRPAHSWNEGRPGGVSWSLQGGTVELFSLDGNRTLVKYTSSAADAVESQNY